MRWSAIVVAIMVLLVPSTLRSQQTGVLGDWQDPTGSILRIDHCGAAICLWVVSLSRSAPVFTDLHNPDPSQRTHSLCGMKIGNGFSLRDPEHALGGTLYDPKTGKTYHGSMTLAGAKLHLRGYIGAPLFGETQTWTRPAAPVQSCNSTAGN